MVNPSVCKLARERVASWIMIDILKCIMVISHNSQQKFYFSMNPKRKLVLGIGIHQMIYLWFFPSGPLTL